MKTINYFFSYIIALCLLLLTLYFSFVIFAFNPSFYEMEYKKYQIDQAVHMEMNALMRVTSHMIDYLDEKKDNLVIKEQIGGIEREFFNDLEKQHMYDVKNLFINGKIIRNTSFIALFSSLAVLILTKQRPAKNMIKAIRLTSIFTLLCMVILGILTATSFTKYFTIFHEIFFTNDLWQLNPATDLLINIVPEPFFIDIVFYITGTFVALLLIYIFVSSVLLRSKLIQKR